MTKERFALKFEALTLWRDGNLAVVSVSINGRWVRVLSADVRELFFEDCDAETLRALSLADRSRRLGHANSARRIDCETRAKPTIRAPIGPPLALEGT
jgi:hypothetical protein